MLVDREGDRVYATAGLVPGRNTPIGAVLEALMGAHPELAQIAEESIVAVTRLGHQVLVRHDVPTPRARWLASLRFAEWWLERHPRPAVLANRLAAAVLAPRASFLRAVASVGPDPARLADIFICPEAMALLRIGEVTGRPVVLVERSNVIQLRGDRRGWSDGLARVRLTDDDRIGMIAS